MAGGRVQYTVGFNADASAAKQAVQDLVTSLQKVQSANLSNFRINTELDAAAQSARTLEMHIRAATNVNTGKLNLNDLVTSINKADTSLSKLLQDIQLGGTTGSQAFKSFSNAIIQTEVPLRNTNKLITNIGTTLKNTLKWQLSSNLIHGLESTLKGAVGYVKELNTSLTDIRIVTGKSLEDMTAFAEQANKAAKQLSTTTKEYTKASLLYYQQGDSDKAAAEKAAITVKAANVAFTASAQEMSQMLTAVWNSYKTGEDQLEHVVDVMAKLGATTATSMEEISTGMQKVAATANTVGVSMEQMSAMIATSSSVTRQSAESVGTAWNTILGRITSLKLGQTLEDGVDLTKYTKALESVGVKALDISGNLREAGTLIDEIGAKWQTMNEAQKTAFAQTVGGVRQYTQIMAFFENFDKYQANMETAMSADGTLQQQADIYAQSWEAASARSRAALEGLYDSLLNDQSFIKMTNMFTGLIEGIEKMVDTLGGASGIMTTIGTVAMAVFANKLPSMLRNLGDMFTNYLTSPIKAYEKSLQEVQRGISDSRSMQDSESLKQTSELVALKQQLIASEGLLSDKQKAAYNTQINALGEEIAHVHDLENAYNNTEKSIDRIISAVGRQKDAYASMSAEARSAISQTITDSSNFQNLNTTYNNPLQAAFANYGSALKIGGVSGTLSAEMQSIIDSGTDASTVIGRITSAISTMQAAVKDTHFESMFANLDSATMAPGKLLREFTLQLNAVQQQADTTIPQMTKQIGEALNSMPDGVMKSQLINQFAAMGEAAGLSADQLVEFASTAKWSQENIEQLKASLDQGATGFNRFAQMAGKAVSMIGSAAATYRTVGNAVTQLNEGTFNLGTALMLITSVAPGVVTAISMIGTAGQAALGWIGLIGILVAGIVAAVDNSAKAAQKAREEAAKAYNEKEQTKVDEHKEELNNTQSLIQNYNQLYETYLKTGEGQEDLAASAQLLADAYNVVGGSVLIAQGRFEEFNELLRNQINFDDQIADLERIANATRTAFNVDRGYEHTTKSSDFMQSIMNPQSYYYQAADAQHNIQVGNKYLNEVMRTGGAYMSTNVEGRMGSTMDYSTWNESNRKLLANIDPLMELFRNDAMYNADGSINWDYVNEAIANFAEQNEEVEAVVYEAMFKAMGINWKGGEPTTTSNLGARLETMRKSTNIDNQITYGQNLRNRTKDPGFWSFESSEFETWFGDLRLQIGQKQMEALESIYDEVIEGYTDHEYGKGLSYSDLVGSNGEIIWNNAEDRYEQYGGLKDLLQQAYSTRETLQAELETADEKTALGIQKMIDDNNAVITELEAIVGDDTDITKAYNTSAEALDMVAELQMTAKQIRSFLGQNEENTSFKEYQTKRQQFVEMVKSQAGNKLYENEFQDYLTLWDESLYGENKQYESRNGYVYDLENQRYLIDEAQQHAFDSAAQSYVDTWLSTYTSFDDYTHAYGDLYGTLGQNSAAMDAATKLIDQGRITIDDITYELLAILGNNINRLAEYTEMDETAFAESDIGRQIALTRAQKAEQDLSINRGTAQTAASKMKSGMALEDAENIRTTFWDAEGNLIEELQAQMEGDISSWEEFTKMSFSERQTYLSKLSKAYDASLLQSEQDIVDAAQKSRIKAETDFEDLKASFAFENALSSFAHPEAIVDLTAEQIKSTRAMLNTYQFDAAKGFYRDGQVDKATFDVQELTDLNLTYEQFIQLEEALQRIENANTAEEAAQARIDALKLIEEATEGATAKINLLKNALDQLPQSATDIEALVKELNQMNMTMLDGSAITAEGLYSMNTNDYQKFMRGALQQRINSTIGQSEADATGNPKGLEIVTDAEAVYYKMLQDQIQMSDEQKKLNAATAQWNQHLSEIQDNADDLKTTFDSLMDKVQNGGALTSLEKLRMTDEQITNWENASTAIERAQVAADVYAASLDQTIQKQTEQTNIIKQAQKITSNLLVGLNEEGTGSLDLSDSTKMIEAFGGDKLSNGLKTALVNAYNAAIEIVGPTASSSQIVAEMQNQLDQMLETVDEESQAVIDELRAKLAEMYAAIYDAETQAAADAVQAWTDAFNAIKNARQQLLGGGTLQDIMAGDIDSTYALVRTVMQEMNVGAEDAIEILRNGGEQALQALQFNQASVLSQMQAKGLNMFISRSSTESDIGTYGSIGQVRTDWKNSANVTGEWTQELENQFVADFKEGLKVLFPNENDAWVDQLYGDLAKGQRWDEVTAAMESYEASVRASTQALEEQAQIQEAQTKRDKAVSEANTRISDIDQKIEMILAIRTRGDLSAAKALEQAGYTPEQFAAAFEREGLTIDSSNAAIDRLLNAPNGLYHQQQQAYNARLRANTEYRDQFAAGGALSSVMGADKYLEEANRTLDEERYAAGLARRQSQMKVEDYDREGTITNLERQLNAAQTAASDLSTELSNLSSIDINSLPAKGTAAYNALAIALTRAGSSMKVFSKESKINQEKILYDAKRSNIEATKDEYQKTANLAEQMAGMTFTQGMTGDQFATDAQYSYYQDWLEAQKQIAAQEEALAATYGEERAAIVGIQDAEWSRQKASYETAKTERATQEAYLDTLASAVETGQLTAAERFTIPSDLIAQWDQLSTAEERAALLVELYSQNISSLAGKHDEMIGAFNAAETNLTTAMQYGQANSYGSFRDATNFDAFLSKNISEQNQAVIREAYNTAVNTAGKITSEMSNIQILQTVLDQLDTSEVAYESSYTQIKSTIISKMTAAYQAVAEQEQSLAEQTVAKWEEVFNTIASLRQNLLSGKSIGGILTEDLDTFMSVLNEYRRTVGQNTTAADLVNAYKSGSLSAKDFQYRSAAEYQQAIQSSYMMDHLYNRADDGTLQGFKNIEQLAAAFGIGNYKNGEYQGLSSKDKERAAQISQLKDVASPYMKEMLKASGMDDIEALRAIEEYFAGEQNAATTLYDAGIALQAAAAEFSKLKTTEQEYQDAKTKYETTKAEQEKIIEKNEGWQDITQKLRFGEESARTDLEGNEDKASEYMGAINKAFSALGIDKKVNQISDLDNLTTEDYEILENYFGQQAVAAGNTIVAAANTFAAIVTGAANQLVDGEGNKGLGYGENTEQGKAAADATTEANNISTNTNLITDQYDRDLSYFAEQVGETRDTIDEFVEAIMQAEGTMQEWDNMTKENQLLMAAAAVEYQKAAEAIETLSNAASLFSAIESTATDAGALEKKAQAYEKLATAVNNYFKDAEVGSKFVEENLEDIKDWANGSIEAMERLEKKILSQQLDKMMAKFGKSAAQCAKELEALNKIGNGLKFGEKLKREDISQLLQMQKSLGLTNKEMRSLADTMGIAYDATQRAVMSAADYVAQFDSLEDANTVLADMGMQVQKVGDAYQYVATNAEGVAALSQSMDFQAISDAAAAQGIEIPVEYLIENPEAITECLDQEGTITYTVIPPGEPTMEDVQGENSIDMPMNSTVTVSIPNGSTATGTAEGELTGDGQTVVSVPKFPEGTGTRPGGGGGGCFVAGTLIATINGYKNIEDIRQNDVVLSYNEKSQQNEYSKVLQTMIHYVVTPIYTLYINGDKLQVTGIHKFYTKRNNNCLWLEVYNLTINDFVLYDNGTWHQIDNISKEFKTINVYNFEVSNNHNYYVGKNRILAHNKGGGGCFEAGTYVTTYEGYKNIEQIQIGDIVLSYNEQSKKNEYSEVLETMIHNVIEQIYTLYIDDDKLVVTGIHRFYIQRDNVWMWIEASNLRVGDIVLLANGLWHKIIQVDKHFRVKTVYNFEVSNNHNYYVGKNKILAHNKGGGGRRESRRRDKTHKPADEKQRYHNTDRQLKKQADTLTKIDKLKQGKYGNTYLKALQAENKELAKQLKLQRDKIKEAEKYAAEDRKRLEDLRTKGESFEYIDKDGNLRKGQFKLNIKPKFDKDGMLDFDKWQDDMFEEYNKKINEWNSLSAEAQEERQGEFDAWLEQWQKLMDEVTASYEEAQDRIEEAIQAILDTINTMSSKTLEGLKLKVELQLDATQFDKDFREYLKTKAQNRGDLASVAERRKQTKQQIKDIQQEIAMYDDAQKEADKKHKIYLAAQKKFAKKYGEGTKEYAEAMAKWAEKHKGEFLTDADYAEFTKAHRDFLLQQLQDLESQREEMKTMWSDLWSIYDEDFDRYKTLMQHKSDLAKQFETILELAGGEEDYDTRLALTDAQYDTAMTLLDSKTKALKEARSEADRILAGRDLSELSAEEREWYDEAIGRVQDLETQVYESTQAALEAARQAFEIEVDKISKKFQEEMLSTMDGISSFDELATEYEWYTEEADRYLTTEKQLYEVSKLNRQINQSLSDATTRQSKERLRALQATVNEQAKLNKLTEYDIQQMNLQYKLALALDALENAEDNKDTVRLVRDENGNMAYQYTADQDKIAEKQQQYEDVLNEINTLARERQRELEQQFVQTQQEYLQQAQEISLMYADDIETRNEKLAELNQRYSGRLKYINDQYALATNHLMTNQSAIYEHYGTTATASVDKIQSKLAELMAKISATDGSGMSGVLQSFTQELVAAMKTHKDKIDEVIGHSGLGGDGWAGMQSAIAAATRQQEDAQRAADRLTREMHRQAAEVQRVTGRWRDLNAEIERTQRETETAIRRLERYIRRLGEAEAAARRARDDRRGRDDGRRGRDDDIRGRDDGRRGRDDDRRGRGSGSGGGNTPRTYRVTAYYTTMSGAPGSVTGTGSSYEAAKRDAISRLPRTADSYHFKTGGLANFTGPAWLDGTKQKPEYVLNPEDTERMFDAIEQTSEMDSDFKLLSSETVKGILDTLRMTAQAMISSLGAFSAGTVSSTYEELQQSVEIHAEFPNAENRDEIAAAFEDLVNKASQYANRKR